MLRLERKILGRPMGPWMALVPGSVPMLLLVPRLEEVLETGVLPMARLNLPSGQQT